MHIAPHLHPLVALLAWIPIGLYFFYRYPVRVAVLLNFIAGWAVLPTANFVPTEAPFPYWILGASLPAGYFVTKATITGLTGLAGVLLFDPRTIRRFHLTPWDFPMMMWCVAPLLSGIANPGSLLEGLRGVFYQLLAWGVPYLLGRLYFVRQCFPATGGKGIRNGGSALCADLPDRALHRTAILCTGLRLSAVSLAGRGTLHWLSAHRLSRGRQPARHLDGGRHAACRRALEAHPVRRLLGLPIAWVAITLFVATLLCQSGGSILLLALPFAVYPAQSRPIPARLCGCAGVWPSLLRRSPPGECHLPAIPGRAEGIGARSRRFHRERSDASPSDGAWRQDERHVKAGARKTLSRRRTVELVAVWG